MAEHPTLQLQSRPKVSRPAHASEQVQQRVEARAAAESLEVLPVDGQVAASGALDSGDQPVDAGSFERLVVLGEHGLGRTSEPAPQRRVDVPVEHLTLLAKSC